MNTDELFFLPINQPAYVGMLEILASSLVWSVYDLKNDSNWADTAGANTLPLAFEGTEKAKDTWNGTNHNRHYVFREALSGNNSRWAEELGKQFGVDGDQLDLLTSSLSEAVKGTMGDKAEINSALPLTPNLALTQNRVGVAGKGMPPNFALIFEQLYALGAPRCLEKETQEAEKGVARLFNDALMLRRENDPFLKKLDKTIMDGIFPVGAELVEKKALLRGPTIGSSWDPKITEHFNQGESPTGANTPFQWFHDSWKKITNEKWNKALPARRWNDWALTVLRTGLGFSTIWMMNWYLVIGKLLHGEISIEDYSELPKWLINETNKKESIKWADFDARPGERDITVDTRALIKRGEGVQQLLKSGIDQELLQKDPKESIEAIRANEEIQNLLHNVLYPNETALEPPKSASDRWELVRYCLNPRGTVGSTADHYAFLSKQWDRSYAAAPATEWVATISSLCCDKPRQKTDLGAIKRELRKLGLHPTNRELLFHLERAGLARGAADADEAVEVDCAF